MSWVLLAAGTLGLLHSLNALAPRKRPAAVFVWSFFGSWLTIELAWHHLLFGLALSVVAVGQGALDQVGGVIGAAVMAVTLLLLLRIAIGSLGTRDSMAEALEELRPAGKVPRFPFSHVALPFLLNHRAGLRRVKHVEFARIGGKSVRLDVTLPSAPVPGGRGLRPALMQIHGGGWVIGDKREQGLPLLNHMAAQGWVCFNVNYRLSPGVAMPEHLVDLKRGLAWIKEHAADYGIDPGFVCVTGGSAGGHLTALMGLTANDPRYQPGFERADTSVAAAVPFYGVYDFTDGGTFGADPDIFRKFLEPIVMKAFLAEEPERFREASPIHNVHAEAPPFFAIHGDKDTLAPVEDARALAAALRDVSREPVLYAELKGAQHAFEVFPSVRTARVVEGVERFLSTLWARRDVPERTEPDVAETLAD